MPLYFHPINLQNLTYMKKIIFVITICLLSFPCFSQGNISRSEKSANETKERQFIIDEFDYKVKVYLQGTPGEMYAVMEQDGMTYLYPILIPLQFHVIIVSS